MPFEVRSTGTASRQIDSLRGTRRKAYDRFEQLPAAQGCKSFDFRLTGPEPLAIRLANAKTIEARGDDTGVVPVRRPKDGPK